MLPADITGKSGMAIIQAILQGQRDPENLVQLPHGRIKADKEDVKRSLQGVWKEENIFELEQSLEMYHLYRCKIMDCDKRIQNILLQKSGSSQTEIVSKKQFTRSNKNNLNFDATVILQQITGTDITELFGINGSNAIEILSETGFDMNKWPTEKHFTAWLNLAPNNKISGGKVLSSRIPKKKNQAGQVFRLAAYAIQRSNNWLALFYHRIKARAGVKKAITATARKIAIIFYKMIKNQVMFNPINIDAYAASFKQRQLKKLERQAKSFGMKLMSTVPS